MGRGSDYGTFHKWGASFIFQLEELLVQLLGKLWHLHLGWCGIQRGGILAIGQAIRETPRAPLQPFHIYVIKLKEVAAELGLPVESGNEGYWSNDRIIRWIFDDFVARDKMMAFASAQIAGVVQAYRPRPLTGNGSGNSVIPAVCALGKDTIDQILTLFINMQAHIGKSACCSGTSKS
jgi:hypothetical protein